MILYSDLYLAVNYVRVDLQALNPDVGAFIIRLGFWGHYTIIIIRNPQNSIGNY